MFGYVLPLLDELPEEERERFRRAYCGLCHTLGRRHGPAARFILNYDFTFLAILLSEPREGTCRCRACVAHPCKKREALEETPALALAADESVVLAYWQLQDGVADHGFWRGLKYRLPAALLRPAYRRAAAARPAFDESTRRQLEALAALEREGSGSIDAAADTFALLLAAAADEVEEEPRRRVLRELLYHLGRWVYLMDAADDLKKDAAAGSYNPLIARFGLPDGVWDEDSRRAFAATADHSVHRMEAAYELWDFGCWSPLLHSMFYTGLFRVGRAVLDGTFHQRERKTKNVEESQ